MIRQSPRRGEPKKERKQAIHKAGSQERDREMQDILAGIFDDAAVDPAELFDPRDFLPRP